MMPRPFETLKAVVAEAYGLTEQALTGRCTDRRVAWPRQMLACMARELIGLSYPQIGRMIGHRDHATIMYAHKRVSERLKHDEISQRKAAWIIGEYTRRMTMGEAA